MMEESREKNGVKGNGVGGLFFQQAPLYGVHSAAAIFFVARAMMAGAGLLGLLTIVTTGVFFFMVFSCMMTYPGKGRVRRRHILAMANGIEVGCEYSQQE
jgi:hypothetical protein